MANIEPTYEQRMFFHLIKTSSADEARAYIRDRRLNKKPVETFVQFITKKIEDKRISRKTIALKSGLSQDYVYKLLNGNKRTDERDYIIAICLAIGLDYIDLQHALELYPFPILDEADERSNLIIICLLNNFDMDEINEVLEKFGFPLIRTSPDMEKAEIGERSVFFFSNKNEIGPIRSTNKPCSEVICSHTKGEGGHVMKELDCRLEKENVGCGPNDIAYVAEIKVERSINEIRYVRMYISMEGSIFSVGKNSWFNNSDEEDEYDEYYCSEEAVDYYCSTNPDDPDMVEYDEYETLMKLVSKSEYFNFFAKLDKKTDEMVANHSVIIPDTKDCGFDLNNTIKIQIGTTMEKGQVIEAYNNLQPEYKEYIQVVKKGDKYRYTASHESCFTAISLGPVYHFECGSAAPDPLYYIDAETIEDIPSKYEYFKTTFSGLKDILDAQK